MMRISANGVDANSAVGGSWRFRPPSPRAGYARSARGGAGVVVATLAHEPIAGENAFSAHGADLMRGRNMSASATSGKWLNEENDTPAEVRIAFSLAHQLACTFSAHAPTCFQIVSA
jgi:hypothetical protein